MDSRAIAGLGPLTDDKSAFRQWDLKLINILNKIQPGYGTALERLKQGIDRGEDMEDVRPGATSDSPIVFGTALIERLRNMRGDGMDNLDVGELDSDLEYILRLRPSRTSCKGSPIFKNMVGSGCTPRCTNGSLKRRDKA